MITSRGDLPLRPRSGTGLARGGPDDRRNPATLRQQYEYDGKLGVFRLDRALYSPMHYPGDYGFIPGTLAEDDDPLDCLVLVQQPSYPGVLIEVRPVGVLNMVDAAEGDQKILAVPTKNP